MKKIFFGIVALVAMVATSCQQFDEVDVVGGETATVSFNLSTPEIANRAFSDGTTATRLQYAVYDANGNALDIYKKDNETINISKQIEFQLTTGNTYSVLFWAAAPSAPYTVDLDAKTMEVDYTNPICSDENRDAFYYYGSFTVSNGMAPIQADLKRPFAQLNIGTSDYAASTAAGYTVSHAKVKVPVYTNLDFVSGDATNKQTVEFAYAAIPTSETFPVAGHEYMAMNYLLMNTTKETVDVKFTYATDATGAAAKSRTVGSVPVQRNHRTNLYGQLFTSNTKVNVEIKPEYEDSYNNEYDYYIDANGAYHFSNTIGLKWFAEQVNAGNLLNATVILDSDIDLAASRATGDNWTPISMTTDYHKTFHGIFNGAGHTISGMIVSNEEAAGLFGYVYDAQIKNVVIDGATINSNHYAGGIVAWINNVAGNTTRPAIVENCSVKNSTITSDPTVVDANGEYNGDKVGGIVGYACFGTSNYPTVNEGARISDCSVEKVTIKGYRDLGGIAGFATYAHIDNNTVADITIVQDLSNNYKGTVPTTLGMYVGRNDGYNTGSNIENVTEQEDVVIAKEATTNEELATALSSTDNATVLLSEGDYDFASQLGNGQNGNLTVVGNGIDNTQVNGTVNSNNGAPGNYAHGKHLVFKDLTYVTASNNNYNGGFGHAASVTFINCKIIGQFYCHSSAPHKFIDCTIDPQTGYLYTYASNCDFEGCTFESSEGKALQVYAEASGTFNVNIKDCTFKAAKVAYTSPGTLEGGGKPVTAIDINSNGEHIKFNVNVENSTATGYGVGVNSGSDLWNIKGGASYVTLTIDGDIKNLAGGSVVSTAAELRSLIENAAVGSTTNIVLAAGTYEGLFNVNGKKTVNIISTAGATIDGLVNGMDWATITLKGLNLKNTNNVGTDIANRDQQKGACVGAYVANITVENCTIDIKQAIGGIYIHSDRTDGWAADWDGFNLRVKNCVFNCNGERPIQCRSNVLIDNCTFNDQYRYSVQIRFNPQDAFEKVTFTNNKIVNPCVTSGKGFAAGITVKTSDEVKDVVFDIAGNTMQSELFAELLHVYDNTNVANLHLDTCTIPDGVTFVPEP